MSANAIIQVRGTHGSGKSTLLRRLWKDHDHVDTTRPGRMPRALYSYLPALNLYLIGDYSRAVANGVDAIQPSDVVLDLARELWLKGNVAFEGAIFSTFYGRMVALSYDIGPGNYLWCFLDTPLALCRERVTIRNRGKKFTSTDDTVGDKFYTGLRQASTLAAMGEDVRWLRHETAYEELLGLIKERLP